MRIRKALRVWSGSVVTGAIVLLAMWGLAVYQLRSTQNIPSLPTERLEQAVAAFLVTSGVAFGIAAMFVYIPTFILLDAFLRRPLNRPRAVLIGSMLALLPRVLIAWDLRSLNRLQPGCSTGLDTCPVSVCRSAICDCWCGIRLVVV